MANALNAKAGHRKLHAVEVRRCRILLSLACSPSDLPEHLRPYLQVGRELVLPRSKIIDTLAALEQCGFKVASVDGRIKRLLERTASENPASLGVPLKYFLTNSDGDGRSFWILDPVGRNTTRCVLAKERSGYTALIRSGSPVIVQTSESRALCIADGTGTLKPLETWQATVAAAHRSCPVATLNYVEAGEYLLLDVGHIWLPPYHRRLLQKVLPIAPVRGQLREAAYYKADKQAIADLLGTLNIRLQAIPRPAAPQTYIETLRLIARLFKDAYSGYLKNQGRVDEFCKMIRLRLWGSVEHPRLKETLQTISNRAFQFDTTALAILGYLEESLPVSIDWKMAQEIGSGPELFGVAVESSSGEFRGHGYKHHRACFPEIGLTLGIHTGIPIAPWWRTGGPPPSFLLHHWRCYPFLGRLKLTPGGKPAYSIATNDEIRLSKIAVLGIPSVEAQLRKELWLSAFQLDLDPTRAKSGLDLSREFAFYGKLSEKFLPGYAVPTSLFHDIFGNPFLFEWEPSAFERSQQKLGGLWGDGWVYGMARSRLISGDSEIGPYPLFQMVAGVPLVPASPERALRDAIAAMAKYAWEISIDNLAGRLKGVSAQVLEEQIKRVAEEGRVAVLKQALLFSPMGMGNVECESFHHAVNQNALEKWQPTSKQGQIAKRFLGSYLSLICPLQFGFALTSQRELRVWNYERQYLRVNKGQIIFLSERNEGEYLPKVRAALAEEGVVRLLLPAARFRTAQDLVFQLAAAMGNDLFTLRFDGPMQIFNRTQPGITYLLASRSNMMAAVLRRSWS